VRPGPLLATIGIGEPVAAALGRVPADGRPLLVVADGRIVRSVPRAALTRPGAPPRPA
jgi:cystathionine beta-synthase